MAETAGLSENKVRRIWRKHGLKPHLFRTFKVSNGPQSAEKLEAIVGLYLNPPEHAIVLCADEKSQIQAVDYKRNGTATLFAAMNALDGAVISMRGDRHRRQEWLKFLRVIDEVIPPTSKSPNRGQLPYTNTPQCRSGWRLIPDSTSNSRRPVARG